MKLPVSELELRFQAPDGNDDLAILEASGDLLERALVALSRLALVKESENAAAAPFQRRTPEYWATLTVTDFETALLGLRRFLFGDKVACVFRDRSHACGVRMELEFSISAFLDEARPRSPRRVRPADDARWHVLPGDNGQDVRFRLPTVEDQFLAMTSADGASLLAKRCIDAANTRDRRRAERVMEEMAPAVSRPLAGNCPECGESLTMMLHVPRLVIDQLENQAASIHEETDAIAATYHWDEASILAMPQRRRRAYADTIRRREQVAV
ncbi:hypothetical protein [Occallatibacter riparius]|uniref:Uncharacterized protein n=1 Tax=Occallatibacter riparius TaxID=1002689 RepID=A0A9J7BGV7_9BACT|nr:hypothetical protein [Occallatibacter riparius]UWZ81753.1 hypothetical protein MOP44_14280 [Occallatibacter riparius]